MIFMAKKEVYPVVCNRCDKVAFYTPNEEQSLNITAFCVRCVTREQDVIKRNESLSEFLTKSGK